MSQPVFCLFANRQQGRLTSRWPLLLGYVLSASTLAIAGAADAKPTAPAVPATAVDPANSTFAKAVFTPKKGENLDGAFSRLHTKGGPYTLMLNMADTQDVPAKLIGEPISSGAFIAAIAEAKGFKVAWVRAGARAILYRGVPDADVKRVLAAMKSTDATKRRVAAWELCQMQDVRAMQPMVDAAKDPDPEVQKWVLTEGHSGQCEILASYLGEAAVPYLDQQVAVAGGHYTPTLIQAYGLAGGEHALAVLGKLVNDKDENLRNMAAFALSTYGGEPARALLGRMLEDKSSQVRATTVSALGSLDHSENNLPHFEKALADEAKEVRFPAAYELQQFGGDKARDLLIKRLPLEKDRNLRQFILSILRKNYADDPVAKAAVNPGAAPEAPHSDF